MICLSAIDPKLPVKPHGYPWGISYELSGVSLDLTFELAELGFTVRWRSEKEIKLSYRDFFRLITEYNNSVCSVKEDDERRTSSVWAGSGLQIRIFCEEKKIKEYSIKDGWKPLNYQGKQTGP